MSGEIFGCHNLRLLAASGYVPEMLFNVLQHTGQLPQPRMIWPYHVADVSCASVESPCSKLQAPNRPFPRFFFEVEPPDPVWLGLLFTSSCVSVCLFFLPSCLWHTVSTGGRGVMLHLFTSLSRTNVTILQCLAPNFVSLLRGGSGRFLSSFWLSPILCYCVISTPTPSPNSALSVVPLTSMAHSTMM